MGVLGHFSQLPDLVPTRGPGLSIWVPVISFTILASKQTNILLFYLCAQCTCKLKNGDYKGLHILKDTLFSKELGVLPMITRVDSTTT